MYIRATNGPCPLSLLFNLFKLLLGLLSTHIRCPWKIKYMDCLYIVSSTDMRRCECLILVIIVCIPCVNVRIYMIHPLHPVFLLCVCFEIAPDNPLISAFIREASDIQMFKIHSTYCPCSFFILFPQIFDSFVDFWSVWKLKPPNPKVLSATVSFLHTPLVHRSVGLGLD